MAKRGLSDIVTTVLIILLVITAVAIIWVFVQNFIFSSSSQLDISTFSEHISIVPQSLVIDKSGSSTTKVAFLVKRNAGQSDLTGLHVIIEDKSGKSVVQRVDVSLKEFETKKVDLVVSGISQVNKISIIPIFLKEGEKEGEGLQYSYSAETASVWNNLLDSSTWIVGSSGSQPGFSKNGLDIENVIELGEGPDGRERVLWKAINQDPDSVIEPSRPDGGWVTSKFNIDKSKTYRFSVWIKKTGSNTGTTYLGAYGSDNNLNYLDGTTITNPYFFHGDLPSLNTWYLVVGYIHPYTYQKNVHLGGIYDGVTKEKVKSFTGASNGNTDFKFAQTASKQYHRVYLYYDTTIGQTQFMYNPRVDVVDGTEPSIDKLLRNA